MDTFKKFQNFFFATFVAIFFIFNVLAKASPILDKQKPVVKWASPPDDWDFKKIARSTVPLLTALNLTANRSNEPDSSDAEYLNYLQHIVDSKPSEGIIKKFWHKITHFNQKKNGIENNIIPCSACKAGTSVLLYNIQAGKSDDEIIDLISKFCIGLNIHRPAVCTGISNLFVKDFIFVLKRIETNPNDLCGFLLGETCGDKFGEHNEWEVELPPISKPTVKQIPIPKKGAPYFKVLQVSDTHYDPHYREGANAQCGSPLCCRESSGEVANVSAAAGKWGDYRKCDTPKRTIDNMLEHIAKNHNIDYILWTGDLPPHDIWNQSKASNLEIIKETVRQMNEHFPGTPIFPAVGNHESSPVNSFPPPYIESTDSSVSWLYNELDSQWLRWLPQSASQSVRRGAFYSVLLRPGFRIISLNMNYCNNMNWWLLLDTTDPASELQWFIHELQTAESANEKVHIIGHIPPGNNDCLKVWSHNFYKIIARYESTITAQFYGHTHFDEFEMFYDPQNLTRPTSVAYIGPSVSPYRKLNPGYRIYYVDGDHEATTRQVINHESWIMNLKEANENDNPVWYKLYTARAAYNLTALRPIDWHNFINEMVEKKDLFELYYRNYWKDSPVRPTCDKECRKRLLCDTKTGRTHDREQLCKDIEKKSLLSRGLEKSYNAALSVADYASSLASKVKEKLGK